MAECLLKQALGTQPKQTFTRVKRDSVLTLLNKQEMDFQDISLSYSQEADQTHGVKHKRTVFQFSMQSSICVNHLDPEQHKLQEKAGKTWSKMEMNIREAACWYSYSDNLKLKAKKQMIETKPQNTHTQ